MKASVITPAYNAANFIEECIENVRSQGDAVHEHIIVDGGSQDGTVEIIERLSRSTSNVRLIRGPDKGQSDAMNKGSAAATAPIIGMLNVDDYYQPNAVHEAVTILAQQTRPSFVAGNCRVINEHGDTMWWNQPNDLRLGSLSLYLQGQHIPANPSAYFYHQEVHDIVGGFDIANHYAMDVDFVLGAASKVNMIYVPRHWGNFRLLPGCKSYENMGNEDPVAPLIDKHIKGLGIADRLKAHLVRQEVLGKRVYYRLRNRLIGTLRK